MASCVNQQKTKKRQKWMRKGGCITTTSLAQMMPYSFSFVALQTASDKSTTHFAVRTATAVYYY